MKFPKYGEMLQKRLARPGGADRQAVQLLTRCQTRGALPARPRRRQAGAAIAFASRSTGQSGKFVETFVTAASPGIITTTFLRDEANPDYKTDKEYVLGVAREMKKEYDYIVAQGHILQLDAPDLAMERAFMFQDQPLERLPRPHRDAHRRAQLAVADIPPEKVRLHVCLGNWDGPHIDDVELAPLLPIIYQAKVGALSIACANPRHQHDWKTLKKNPLPRDMMLIPGVIDVTTNYLEHPEVVADRIELFVDVMGGDRSAGHRRHRLRLLDDRRLYHGGRGRRLGEAQGAERGREDREQAALGLGSAPSVIPAFALRRSSGRRTEAPLHPPPRCLGHGSTSFRGCRNRGDR